MVNSTANQLPMDVQFEKQLGQLATLVRGMRRRLVHFWNFGGYEPTTMQKLGRLVGITVFGVEEAVQHFRVQPTREQLSALAEIPFTEAELRECKDSHILVAVFPMSILDVHSKVKRKLFFYSHKDAWYNKESFAKDRGEAAWHLVRKTPVPNSTSKTWDEQQVLLAKNEETPTAQVMVYTIIGHFLATGERLFENVCVRCSDVDLFVKRVYVGYFGSYGLLVRAGRGNDRCDPPRPGLGSEVRLNLKILRI